VAGEEQEQRDRGGPVNRFLIVSLLIRRGAYRTSRPIEADCRARRVLRDRKGAGQVES